MFCGKLTKTVYSFKGNKTFTKYSERYSDPFVVLTSFPSTYCILALKIKEILVDLFPTDGKRNLITMYHNLKKKQTFRSSSNSFHTFISLVSKYAHLYESCSILES